MSARAPNITPTKYALSVVFVIAGVATFTYAMTRTVVTENVLNIAAQHVENDLVAHQRRPDPANPTVFIDPDVALAARQLIGRVHGSGGMYYWHNDAILC
ncbi:MAG: hypothetical protein KDA32_05660 [Phycisphaerales bacterium]|nr:hypothetical protein [Phycisphaerales bacterium]